MKTIENKHPLAIRWFHWLNFPLLGLMMWSGLLIYWANSVYSLHIGSWVLFKFFPKSFYEFWGVKYRLAEGMLLHFMFMWAFMLNGVLYVGYTLLSGEWRYLRPSGHVFKEAWAVILHDLGLNKNPLPKQKFNAAQQIAYTSIIVMGIGSVLTGIAIYKPIQLAWLCQLLGGYASARFLHFALTIGYVLFFFVHIFQVIKAGWNNFQAMITGFEVKNTPPVALAEPDDTEPK